MKPREQLLLALTRCSDVDQGRSNPSHPCAAVVNVQDAGTRKVPEPWSGHIETAPILFIGSNPSIGEGDGDPTSCWTEADTVSYFQRRFDRDAGWVSPDEFNKVRFWTSVRARATELLGRKAVPGEDFTLTEVVHCKSRGEQGVSYAVRHCAAKWLSRVVSQSAARVVVLLGRHAESCCVELWRIEASRCVHFDVPIAGRSRSVVVLPHPNAFKPKTVAAHATGEELRRLRGSLSPGRG